MADTKGETVYDHIMAAPALIDATEPGRRARKKQQTRDELIRHAIRLFNERGFDETTTADIAEAADVSQRTFFRHFPSKEAVLYGDVDERRQLVRQRFDERPLDESLFVSVREAFSALVDSTPLGHEKVMLQARLAASYPSVGVYSRAVVQTAWEKELIEAVSLRLDVDPAIDPRPEIIAGGAMSALRHSLRRYWASNGRVDLTQALADALDDLGRLHDL